MGTVFGIVALVLVLAWAGFGNVWGHMSGVGLAGLSAYVLFTLATYLLRAWRFRLLMGNKPAMPKLLGIVSIHTLMINIFPFSVGEISYPLLLKRYGLSEGFAQGVPSLIIARGQDIVINLCLVAVALVWAGEVGLILELARDNLIVAGVVVVLTGAAAVLANSSVVRNSAPAVKLQGLLTMALSSVRTMSPAAWASTVLISLAARITALVGLIYLLGALGVDLGVSQIFLYSSLYIFIPYLPINTPGGIGVMEGFSAAVFVYSGLELGAAAAAGLQIHLLQLAVATTLGGLGLLGLQRFRGQDRRRSDSLSGSAPGRLSPEGQEVHDLSLVGRDEWKIIDRQRHASARDYVAYESMVTEGHLGPLLAAEGVGTDMPVLDVGCGMGGGAISLSRSLSTSVVGVDISEEYISEARKAASESDARVSFHVGGITRDDIPSGPYAAILMHDVVEHIPDPQSALERLRPLLDAGGFMYVSFPPWRGPYAGHHHNSGSMLRFMPYLHAISPRLFLGLARRWEAERTGWLMDEDTIVGNRLSMRSFEGMVRRSGWTVRRRTTYLLRPEYMRMGLPKLSNGPVGRVPFLGECLTTGCEYVLVPR